MPVSQIFFQYGEEYFREQEKLIIKDLSGCCKSVIATGGGAILLDENIRNLKNCGVVVCLSASPETIVKRLERDKAVRPLLKCPKRFERVTELLRERSTRYQTADLRIDTDALTPFEVAENVIHYYFKARKIACRQTSQGVQVSKEYLLCGIGINDADI
jgi:shikimate kinase